MKTITYLSLTLTAMTLLGLHSPVQACTTVTVNTTDTTGKGGTLVLNLNSTPVEIRNIGLVGGGTSVQTLNVGPLSSSTMTLKAQVAQDTLLATCEIPVSSCVMDLTISQKPNATCVTPPESDPESCKHDNGNHWGEYAKLGLTVPAHSGKPNATKPCKGKNALGTPAPSGQTCLPILNCQFTAKTTTPDPILY
jgi:hypothetical protein